MQSKAHRGDSHPMRSPWWIVPLALLLAFEWWSRRRSGLA
jgi:MYXO-CTERM domain-containing protein